MLRCFLLDNGIDRALDALALVITIHSSSGGSLRDVGFACATVSLNNHFLEMA